MCRHKHVGRERCKSDTSEARRLRRKNKQALDSHSPIPVFEPAVPADDELIDFPLLLNIEDMKAEAATVAELLKAPLNPDAEQQREIDAILERRVTYLGNALANEAEQRARFNQETFERSYRRPNWETLAGIVLACEIPEETNRQIKMREEAMSRLTEAYKSVLADIRPVGGDLNLNDSSSSDAVDRLNNSVGKHFPADWIKASSDETSMVVYAVDEDKRASYSASQYFPDNEDGEKVLMEREFEVEEAGLQAACDKLSSGLDRFEPSGEPKVLEDGTLSYTLMVPTQHPFDPEVDSADFSGRPNGEGWKHGYIMHDDGTFSEDRQWYRNGYYPGSNLPRLSLTHTSQDPTDSSAYHEFTHRSEQVVGNSSISRMQRSFIIRRTTDASGKREPLVPSFPGAEGQDELARRDNFMISYIGKEYDNNVHYEVMAIGSEALFAGKYGCFLGLDNEHKADTDHRAFSLGLFATA